jgi:hypothetical protein
MKDRSTQDTSNRSHAVANDIGVSSNKSNAAYQIDDRRAASVMQRKFRNLANGLASANIIQPKTNILNIESKTPPIQQNSKELEQ